MITREELRQELERFATKDDLERFATKEDLTRFATKEELRETRAEIAAHREETAQGFADLRRYMEVLYEDMRGTLRTVLDTLVSRADARDRVVDQRLDGHDTQLTDLELRVTKLEH